MRDGKERRTLAKVGKMRAQAVSERTEQGRDIAFLEVRLESLWNPVVCVLTQSSDDWLAAYSGALYQRIVVETKPKRATAC